MPNNKNNAKAMDSRMMCSCPCCCSPWRIIAIVIALIVVPLLFIWSIDTLFSLAIGYSIFTWFAALVVVVVLSGKGMKRWRMGCNQCNCAMMNQKK